jgi:hypothetical protein
VALQDGVIYVQARGTVLRDLRFDPERGAVEGRDISLPANHLFEGHTLKAIAWQQQPHRVLWVVRDDGVLLSVTYSREDEVVAWARHDTVVGEFEDVAVIPDTSIGEDVVYVIVKRTINGNATRYIERLETRFIENVATDAFFVDSGLSYNGIPTLTLTGLSHLEGEVVAVLGDGVEVYDGDPAGANAAQFTVTGGQITLSSPVSVAHVGLPIRFAEIELLDLDAEGTNMRGYRKRVQGVTVFVEQSDTSFLAGPNDTQLTPAKRAPWVASGLLTESIEISVDTNWGPTGKVRLRHTSPLPWHVLAAMPHIEVGGG